jgi:hypothetical protein
LIVQDFDLKRKSLPSAHLPMRAPFKQIALGFLPAVLTLPSPSNPSLGRLPGSSTESSPNPIASQYPNDVTGTLNGTIAVVPIPYGIARQVIPSKYNILTAAYESLLPGFPANSYPASPNLIA